jgi:hypothetical protein
MWIGQMLGTRKSSSLSQINLHPPKSNKCQKRWRDISKGVKISTSLDLLYIRMVCKSIQSLSECSKLKKLAIRFHLLSLVYKYSNRLKKKKASHKCTRGRKVQITSHSSLMISSEPHLQNLKAGVTWISLQVVHKDQMQIWKISNHHKMIWILLFSKRIVKLGSHIFQEKVNLLQNS